MLRRHVILCLGFVGSLYDPLLAALLKSPCQGNFIAQDPVKAPHVLYTLFSVASSLLGLLLGAIPGLRWPVCVGVLASVVGLGQCLLALSIWNDSCGMFSAGWIIVCSCAQGLAVLLVSIVCRHFVVWDLSFAIGVIICSGVRGPGFLEVVFSSLTGGSDPHNVAVLYTSAICLISMLFAIACAVIDNSGQGASSSSTPSLVKSAFTAKPPRLTEVQIREAAEELLLADQNHVGEEEKVHSTGYEKDERGATIPEDYAISDERLAMMVNSGASNWSSAASSSVATALPSTGGQSSISYQQHQRLQDLKGASKSNAAGATRGKARGFSSFHPADAEIEEKGLVSPLSDADGDEDIDEDAPLLPSSSDDGPGDVQSLANDDFGGKSGSILRAMASIIATLKQLPALYWMLVVTCCIMAGLTRPFDVIVRSIVEDHRGPFSQQWFLDLAAELVALYHGEIMALGPLMGMLIDRIGRRPALILTSACIAFIFFLLFIISVENWQHLPNWRRVFLAPELLLSLHAVAQAMGMVSIWSSLILVLPSRLSIPIGVGVAFTCVNMSEFLLGLIVEQVDPFDADVDAWAHGLFCTFSAIIAVMAVSVGWKDNASARGHLGLLSLPASRAKRRDGYTRLSNATPSGSEHLALLSVEVPDSRVVSREDLRLEAVLGSGASGTVFRARWHGGIVAAKRINLGAGATPQLVCDEIKVMVMLSHPNVVSFYGTACRESDIYILSEFCPLGTLFDVLHDASRRMDELTRVSMAVDAAAGMVYLHSRGIIHRDLKSLNLLVTNALNVKVADFGLSRLAGDNGKDKSSALGTVHWQAPEVLKDGLFSYKSDVFSFGVVLWELLSPHDQSLYPAMLPINVALHVLEGGRPAPLPDVTPLLLEAMKQCWKHRPARRPPLAQVLETLKIARNGIVRSSTTTTTTAAAAAATITTSSPTDDEQSAIRVEE